MATIKLQLVSVNQKPVDPKTQIVKTSPRGSERENDRNRIESRIISIIDWKANQQQATRK